MANAAAKVFQKMKFPASSSRRTVPTILNMPAMLRTISRFTRIFQCPRLTCAWAAGRISLAGRRGAVEAERDHGLQGLRREPLPAGVADLDRRRGAERRALRVRPLLCPRRQSETGSPAGQDQGAAHPDLPEAGTQVDHGQRLAHLLLPVFRSLGIDDGRSERIRTGSQEFPDGAPDRGGTRPLEPLSEGLGLRERLV